MFNYVKTFIIVLLATASYSMAIHSQVIVGEGKVGFTVKPVPILNANASFFEPSGNGILEEGEEGKIVVKVMNNGNAPARKIQFKVNPIESDLSGISIAKTPELENLTPGREALIEMAVIASDIIAEKRIALLFIVMDSSGIEMTRSSEISFLARPREIETAMRDDTPPDIVLHEPLEFAGTKSGLPVTGKHVTDKASIRIRGTTFDSGGVAIVRINHKDAFLTPARNGVDFVGDALLTFGENTIEIVAIDKNFNQSRIEIPVRRIAETPPEKKDIAILKDFRKRQVWSVVIGISYYQNSTDIPSLRYAHRDAQKLFDFLITPLEEGGRGVAKANTRLLLNENATKLNIQEALFDFTKNAIEDDIVIIFFAGHGAMDPVRKDVPYLLAYDSDLEKPGATAVRMSDIQSAIHDYIKAERIIIFIDACHSAGASREIAMRGLADPTIINKFLYEIAKSGSSVLTFSASETNELSQESPKWGGGHGVFTYFLLEGLRGKADFDDDKIVRLGELVDFVESNVKRETYSQQHPLASPTRWDRNLPMSINLNK